MIYGKTGIVAEAIYKTKLRHMIFQIGKDRVVVKGYVKSQASNSHFSQSFLLQSVSHLPFNLTRKRIDNPDLYPIQLQILINEQCLKFQLGYDEETEALKLTVNDVPFEQLDFRSASLAPTTLEAVEKGIVFINRQ